LPSCKTQADESGWKEFKPRMRFIKSKAEIEKAESGKQKIKAETLKC
jgi:hypothetical protein